jgi:hypothetical protein
VIVAYYYQIKESLFILELLQSLFYGIFIPDLFGLKVALIFQLIRQIGLTINGGGLSTITRAKEDLSSLRHLPSSLPYHLRKGGDVFTVCCTKVF